VFYQSNIVFYFVTDSPFLFTQGRAKMKKYGGALLVGMLMKGGMMAMAYKAVALLAGKALMVAKVALVLSSIVALKKLVSSGGDEKVTYEIVKHPHVTHSHSYSSEHYGGGHFDPSGGGGGGGDHYRRSMESMYPHLLAYRGQHQLQGNGALKQQAK
jgi:hypothetical protein